jgi:hypothetical protein
LHVEIYYSKFYNAPGLTNNPEKSLEEIFDKFVKVKIAISFKKIKIKKIKIKI